ncbi:MAG: hypothetical protein PVG49_01690 [Desulfobacteraceae bacterium]|jgi:hypothetical protein
MMKEPCRTLCFPDGEKTCFACCPPIRAAGYEHIQYREMIRRMLRENTAAFLARERTVVPITGFSCWALGYLDSDCRLVGCLLHPARHHGMDLRFRVDFGEKCRRETCPEAHIFERLEPDVQAFWLHPADGLDTFSYSSRKENPLFHYLNWGPKVLRLVARAEPGAAHSPASLLEAFPFLETPCSPRAFAYPLARLVERQGADRMRDIHFKEAFENWIDELIAALNTSAAARLTSQARPVHRLPQERTFLDFLRLGAGIPRATLEAAEALHVLVEAGIDRFCRDDGLGRSSLPAGKGVPAHRYRSNS